MSRSRRTISEIKMSSCRIQKNRFSSVMGLPIDAKTDWQAVCNAEVLLCSPKTLRNAFRFIASVLGENGINATKVTLPPLNTNPRQWLEPEQIPPLIAAAVGTPSAFPVMLALHSLRRSELLAVPWDDIDLDAGTIRVSVSVVQNEDHHFACSFACCLLAIKKPLGSLRAALFISPMIFSLCPFGTVLHLVDMISFLLCLSCITFKLFVVFVLERFCTFFGFCVSKCPIFISSQNPSTVIDINLYHFHTP